MLRFQWWFEKHLPVTVMMEKLDPAFRELFERFRGAVDLSPGEFLSRCGPEEGLQSILQDVAPRRFLRPFVPVFVDRDGPFDGWRDLDACTLIAELRDAFDGS